MWIRVVQLVLSCAVLGVGVALLLTPALGSDGFSTMVSGLSLSLDAPFLLVNVVVGVILVGLAWLKGRRPALGTVVQPVVTGTVVTAVLELLSAPSGLVARSVMLLAGFAVVAVGVAGYLGSDTGSGPAEALSTAYDPPIPFRWSYSVFQGASALLGWLLGAAVGPGTVLVVLLLGPAVDLVGRLSPRLRVHAA
ncbi:hypothetical protein [Nakamurella deserti]|uniref:hypothetical protein n=1 Tax=Nakamurella deserti TaxID=2164074 RepID=UPI000DBE9FF1|nr:hypothetical protein [Nakamurella deserti]